MVIVAAALSIGIFTLSLVVLDVVKVGAQAVTTAGNALAAIRSKELSEEQRENLVQRASIRLMAVFFSIFMRSAIALGLAFLPIWFFDTMGWVSRNETLLYLGRWEVITISTVLIVLGFVTWRRFGNSP